ncbi:MAG: dTDP-glucose 4,6-dehydratase [Rhodothermales bacterium]|jgi:dTDP-glucose 4,6-dehydratase
MTAFHKPHSVVLGGAGFVGSHLCDFLLEEGHRVTCIDNLATGREVNIHHLLENADFSFSKQDIRNQIEVDGPVDFVYNMASPASPKHYLEMPFLTLETGSIGTQNALELARRHGARFLLASTSEVYGDPEVHPQVEEYWGRVNSIGPRSVYDEAKRFGEAITMAYHRERETDTVIVRIFNTYGPRMRPDDGRALPAFVSQALAGEPITIFGDGLQTRSFCFVQDLVRGLHAAATSTSCGPINLGNPSEVTIAEFAREVLAITSSSSELTFHPLPTDDPTIRQPDITKARTLLNWEPRVSREDGLRETIAYFREELGYTTKSSPAGRAARSHRQAAPGRRGAQPAPKKFGR